MKANINQIRAGFSKWYLKGVAPLGWKSMLATPIVNLAVSNFLKKHANTITLLTDEDGGIDIDTLHKEYSEIWNKCGTVELFGIVFGIQDLDALYDAVKAEIPLKAVKE